MSIYNISGDHLSKIYSAIGQSLAFAYDLSNNIVWNNASLISSQNLFGKTANWKFKLISNISNSAYNSTKEAAIDYDDSSWKSVTIPHDWSIRNNFNSASKATYEGGYLDGGDGWYRCHFTIPTTMISARTLIYFDGIYMESTVYLNGNKISENHMGYNPFYVDISNYIHEDNVLAVFVRNPQPSSRWYSGSGIYRPVYVIGTVQSAIAVHDVKVAYPNLKTEYKSNVNTIISGTIENYNDIITKDITIKITKGSVNVKSITASLSLNSGSNEFSITIPVNKPNLWDIGKPNTYTVSIIIDGAIHVSEVFGYRFMEWSVDTGFWLNGNNVKIKGVCMHHDLGCIGAEVNKSAMERQIDIMINMGCNAIRLTHNPSSELFLNLCRDKGILCVEELFDAWSVAKCTYDFSRYFSKEYKLIIKNVIERDFNNPAIIMWSVGNEINRVSGYSASTVTPIISGIIDAVHEYDTTRAITMGEDRPSIESSKVCMNMIDVCGINYNSNNLSVPHSLNKPCYGSETTSTLSSRGIYKRDNTNLQCSSFDDDKVSWGDYASTTVKTHMENEYSGGMFVWTGFDYIGEPTPFNKYPAKSSYFGIVDTAGFPKDIYYMYQSRWTTTPMIHIVPMDWDNWTEGETVKVWIYSNCSSVELFQDDVSLGKMTSDQIGDKYQFEYNVTFKKGRLIANGYDASENILVNDEIISSDGIPAKIKLTAYKDSVDTSSDDMTFIECTVCDSNGIMVPNASNEITFTCNGGTIIGTDNGNAACVENMRSNSHSAFSGKCLCVCFHDGNTGDMIITATSSGLEDASITISKI